MYVYKLWWWVVQKEEKLVARDSGILDVSQFLTLGQQGCYLVNCTWTPQAIRKMYAEFGLRRWSVDSTQDWIRVHRFLIGGDEKKLWYALESDDDCNDEASYDCMLCPQEDADNVGERNLEDVTGRKEIDEVCIFQAGIQVVRKSRWNQSLCSKARGIGSTHYQVLCRMFWQVAVQSYSLSLLADGDTATKSFQSIKLLAL